MPTIVPFPTTHPSFKVKNGRMFYNNIHYRYLTDVYAMLGLRSSEITSLDEAVWDSMTIRNKAISYAPYYDATKITRVGQALHIYFGSSLVIVEKANVYTPDNNLSENALEFLSLFS